MFAQINNEERQKHEVRSNEGRMKKGRKREIRI
jgi:hypothetical protein